MIIQYSKSADHSIPPSELKANTLYDFVHPDDTVSRILVSVDFKAIEIDENNKIDVWDYEDIRKEDGFIGKFYISETVMTIQN